MVDAIKWTVIVPGEKKLPVLIIPRRIRRDIVLAFSIRPSDVCLSGPVSRQVSEDLKSKLTHMCGYIWVCVSLKVADTELYYIVQWFQTY